VTQPDIRDVAAVLNKFKEIPDAPIHARAQLQANAPGMNAAVNIADVASVVDGFKKLAYPFLGPSSPCGTFAAFTDSVSGFATSDVRDVDNEIINFNPTRMSIVYVSSGAEYQVGSWPVNGNFLGNGGFFQVRFGTVLGEHRAYFTETGSGTICNFVVTPTTLSIFATSTQVPHT